QRHIHVRRRTAGERRDVVAPVAVEVANERNLVAGGEVVVPLPTRTHEAGTGGQPRMHVGRRTAGERGDVVAPVAVEVASELNLLAGGEVVVPLPTSTHEAGTVGQRHIHVGRRTAGERGDVVAPVAVEVANERDLVAGGEVVVPLPTRTGEA